MTLEHRRSPRKIFRTPITVSMPGGATHSARSYDFGIGGMAFIIPTQLVAGEECTVSFEFVLARKPTQVSAVARIVYCINCAEGFKTGLKFIGIDDDGMVAIQKFLDQTV